MKDMNQRNLVFKINKNKSRYNSKKKKNVLKQPERMIQICTQKGITIKGIANFSLATNRKKVV